MEGAQALRRVFLQGPDHKDGGEVHGADGDALPTPNTDGGSLFPGLLPGGQTQKAVGVGPVSYTHLDVYKRQEKLKPDAGDDHPG